MAEQHFLHLGWRDVLAADTEDILQPPDHAQPALRGELAEVAGAQPPVVGEGLGVRLGVVVVALHHVPAAHLDLALGRDAHFHALVRLGESLHAELFRISPVAHHDVGRCFRESVRGADLLRAQDIDDLAHGLRPGRGPAAAQGKLALREVLVAHQHLEDGVVARDQRAALALEQLQRRARLERRQRDERRSRHQRHERRERRAGDVEERPAVEVAILRPDADAHARRPGVAQHVVVREHRALRIGGRAGGELDEERLARRDGAHVADRPFGQRARDVEGPREAGLAHHGAEIDVEKARHIEERLAVGPFEAVGDLRRLEPRVHRHSNGAD